MKTDSHFNNCSGCVSLGNYEGETVCYNFVNWLSGPVPENPHCHKTPESQETPEYKAFIESQQALLRMMHGSSRNG